MTRQLFLPFIIGCVVGTSLYYAKNWWGFLLLFPWIGGCISLGLFIASRLPRNEKDLGRRISILLISPMFLLFLGIYQRENLQLEQTVFYLAAGVFSRVLIHYAVAKVFGPLIWGRGFCGWACWTAAFLEWLPIRENTPIPKHFKLCRWIILLLSLAIPLAWIGSGYDYQQRQLLEQYGKYDQLIWFLIGNGLYYLVAFVLAFLFRKKRAFCKIACPVSLVMKLPAHFARIRIRPSGVPCIECRRCSRHCPMDVPIMEFIRENKPVSSTECILCGACKHVCPVGAIK